MGSGGGLEAPPKRRRLGRDPPRAGAYPAVVVGVTVLVMGALRAELVQALERRGCRVQVARDTGEALRLLSQATPDLVIFDPRLPGLGEFFSCGMGCDSPPLLQADWPACAPSGQPPAPPALGGSTLLRRVDAVLGWKGHPRAAAGNRANPMLDHRQRCLRVGWRTASLTPQQYALLAVFTERPGEPLAEAELRRLAGLEKLSERSLEGHVYRLREKLQTLGADPHLLETVHGFGYRWRTTRPATRARAAG